MYKKRIKYVDFDGVEREEDFYFNLTKAELYKMELSVPGGLGSYLQQIIDSKKVPEIAKAFDKIILMSYGEKSADGRRFVKSKEISDEFSQTEAYSVLFTELITDADKAAEFVNGILPNKEDVESTTATAALTKAVSDKK